jgi:hypothetical protein
MTADSTLRRSRLKLLALMAIFALPMLVAWVMVAFRIGIPDQRTAHGELAPEVPVLADWPIEAAEDALGGDWLLAFDCAEDCDASADQWWRVHRALGREAHRISRLRIGEAAEALPGETLARWTSSPDWRDPGRLWVLDPDGRPVLSYASGVDAADVLDDIEKLLRMNPEQPGNAERELARR